MLKKKIEKLISLIENTEIEEIEISSFWGAQKIRLSKSKKSEASSSSILKEKETLTPRKKSPICSHEKHQINPRKKNQKRKKRKHESELKNVG